MRHDIYFLYSDPVEGSRTGHAAILITRAYQDRAEIVRYFSMYHAILPDDIRRLPLLGRFTRSISPAFIDSYYDDVIMRGQSLMRYMSKEKENITVPDILNALQDLPAETKERYFSVGQFHHVLQLPSNLLNPYMLIHRLDAISDARASFGWAMCSPLTGIFFDPLSHNCCSAISDAVTLSQEAFHGEPYAVSLTKAVLVFSILAFYRWSNDSEENNASWMRYLPMLLPLMLALQAIYNAHIYVKDLKAMAKKGGPDLLTLVSVYSLCMTVNIVGSPFTSNACEALFMFPSVLARSLKSLPGVREIPVTQQPRFFSQLPSNHDSSVLNRRHSMNIN